jgi:tetratricopeptide (TPR) repeat protein
MSHRTHVLFLAVALAVVSGSATVHAQQPHAAGNAQKERARQLHEQGLRHYEAGQYGRAVAAYRKAYALVPVPGILFNLAQAYRLRGDCRRAHRAYRSFLRAAPGTPEAKLAEEHIASLRSCAAREKEKKAAQLAAGAATGTATGAATAQPSAPPRGPATPAGTTSQPQFSDGSPFDAPPAETTGSSEPIAPAFDLASTRDHGGTPGRRKKMVGLGVGAAGAVLTVVGVYYGLRANSDANDLNTFFDDGGTWTPELAEREDALDRNRSLALGFSLIGVAAAGTGAVFYWLGHQEATATEAARRGSVSLAPQSNGAVLQWRGEF